MAGGLKVAARSAVGPGPWCWGAGGGGVAWLLFVLFGCVVCGSGTTRAAAAGRAGARAASCLEKWVFISGARAARYPAGRRGAGGRPHRGSLRKGRPGLAWRGGLRGAAGVPGASG